MPDTKLPPYNTGIARLLNYPDDIKMTFPNVGMRFYPLRADISRLQKLCDEYLNFTAQGSEPPPVYFKPAAPFVLLEVVNYPRLEIDQLGWLIQHEAIFSVPLEWYRRVDGKLVFTDWAMTYPFIYLDHPISIWMGREMYGWPKVPLRVPRLFPLVNPPDPHGHMAFDLGAHSRGNPDDPEPFRRFIEVRQGSEAFSWMPANLGDLCDYLPRAVRSSWSTVSAMVDSLLGARVWNGWLGGARAEPYARMMWKGARYLSDWLPGLWSMYGLGVKAGGPKFAASPFMRNNIVLKQFRDAQDVESACYQAIVKSEIAIDQVRGGGWLFDPLSADSSGAVSIKLHDFKTQPVVETLGLEVFERTTEGGHSTVTLKPFFPFWWNLNLRYGSGQTICWRARNTKWSTNEEGGAPAEPHNDYVKVGSGALEEIAGPEHFPDFVMRIVPLEADPGTLAALCHARLDNPFFRFEPAAPFVLMVADQFKDMASAGTPGERWADSEVTFAIAARCFDRQKPNDPGRPVILPMLGFVGSEWNAISGREVYGRFNLASTFIGARQKLMGDLAPAPAGPVHNLFSVTTSLCPTLDEDEQTRRWTVLEVAAEDSARGRSANALEKWLAELGLEAIAETGRVESVALKQFRDATYAEHACYQALVEVAREFGEKRRQGWIPGKLRLTIFEFETLDIVKTFGLAASGPIEDRYRPRHYVIETEKAFWSAGPMEQGRGRNLCWRAGAMDWRRG